jgi:hypothetical protein
MKDGNPMTQADSVLSTPPINTSVDPTRRFETLKDAEDNLKEQGFRLVPGTCNWTDDAGQIDAGVYPVEQAYGVKYRIEYRDATPTEEHSKLSSPVDPSRRRFLAVSAVASVVGASSLAVAAMAPPIPAAVTMPADPMYAAIERHKETCIVWDAAASARSDFADLTMTAEQRRQCDELDDAIENTWRPCERAGVDLINTTPTTLAGIVAAIRYIKIQMKDDGTYMPRRIIFAYSPGYEADAKETLGWIDAFLDTIVIATDALGDVVTS